MGRQWPRVLLLGAMAVAGCKGLCGDIAPASQRMVIEKKTDTEGIKKTAPVEKGD